MLYERNLQVNIEHKYSGHSTRDSAPFPVIHEQCSALTKKSRFSHDLLSPTNKYLECMVASWLDRKTGRCRLTTREVVTA